VGGAAGGTTWLIYYRARELIRVARAKGPPNVNRSHVGSNMAHDVDFERADFEHAALKFQAGTPDVAGPVGLAAAVRFFEAAGPLRRRHDDELVRYGLARLAEIPRARIIGPRAADRRVPVFTFVVGGHASTSVARALDARALPSGPEIWPLCRS
jgi:selenocysteine lyase/cysteine desulfurase